MHIAIRAGHATGHTYVYSYDTHTYYYLMYKYSVRITIIVVNTMYCTPCKTLQLHAQYLVFYERITLQLHANYETPTFVLLIRIRSLRYFLRL